MEFLKEYTLASLRLKKEKWKKIIISDEQKEYLVNFIESDYPDFMVISQNAGGHVQIHIDWPSELKYKGISYLQQAWPDYMNSWQEYILSREKLSPCLKETISTMLTTWPGEISIQMF